MSFTDVAFFTILFLGTCNVHGFPKPKHDKVVVCYVASWAAYRPGNGAFLIENLRTEHCTHLIYAFAGINASDWTIRSLDPWADMEKDGVGNYRKMTALHKQGVKVLLGVGGWNEGSANYSKMAASPDSRKAFVASTFKFLNTYGFDGLDLDWEYPGSRGGALYDKQNFVSLVKELRDIFKNRFLLTAAISAANQTINTAYDIPEISKYLDHIHVMAYDYHGAWDKQVLPNSPLRSTDGLSVENTITYLLRQGAPADKLVLGLAMYGRTFNLTKIPESLKVSPIGLPSLDTGFKGPYTSQEGFMGFNEICEALVFYPQDWTTGWDNHSSTAYAIKKDNVVVYDDHKAMIAKVEYVKKQNLAGVMIWSIDTDDFRGNCASLHGDMMFKERDYPLMRAINAALANNTTDKKKNNNNSSSVTMLSYMVFVLSIAMIYLSF
ncbi:probable chitinase 2 [Linepithema humile]|uniref:probable chitinase 2 n=1 Tax=Linepithema humile TaxID=83485 RepID=UPI00351F44B4